VGKSVENKPISVDQVWKVKQKSRVRPPGSLKEKKILFKETFYAIRITCFHGENLTPNLQLPYANYPEHSRFAPQEHFMI
jgi:hypothetical protein